MFDWSGAHLGVDSSCNLPREVPVDDDDSKLKTDVERTQTLSSFSASCMSTSEHSPPLTMSSRRCARGMEPLSAYLSSSDARTLMCLRCIGFMQR